MQTFFRYYFWAAIVFSVLSALVCGIYAHLISRAMAARHPDRPRPLYRHRWRALSPFEFHRRFTATIHALGDPKLNALLGSYIIWLKCSLSVFFTVPAGMLVRWFLLHTK